MDQTSKRDIYDLIAELAKSADINIEGSEFIPEINSSMKKTISDPPITESISQKPHTQLIHLETPAFSAPQKESDLTEEWNQARQSTLHEINLLKAALIEELSQTKTAMLQELQHAKSSNETATNTSTVHEKQHEEATDPLEKRLAEMVASNIIKIGGQPPAESAAKGSHISELQELKQSIEEEIIRLQELEATARNKKEAEKKKASEFTVISIEELNKITAAFDEKKENDPAMLSSNTTSEHISNAAISEMHAQMKMIDEKLELLDPKNIKTEIINEVKRSNERIMEQVHKNKEDLRHDIAKIESGKSNPSYLRWMLVVNLILLTILIAYICYQKFSSSAVVQLEDSADPANKSSSSVKKQTSDQTASPISVYPVPENNSGSLNELPEADQAELADPAKPLQTKTPGYNTKARNQQIQTATTEKSESMEAKEYQDSHKSETAKKTASSQDVYFGED